MHALVFPLYKSVHTLVSVISVGNRSIIARNVIFSPYPFSKERERERGILVIRRFILAPSSFSIFQFEGILILAKMMLEKAIRFPPEQSLIIKKMRLIKMRERISLRTEDRSSVHFTRVFAGQVSL